MSRSTFFSVTENSTLDLVYLMTIDLGLETTDETRAVLYNHVAPSLSELDIEIIKSVPPGGNWDDIPLTIAKKSKRIMQIRRSGGRTTYYGRLRNDLPSYTVSTYFHRPGNGSFAHPEQDRMISVREAARLQSFFDDYRFLGSASSQYKQVGNAVPPLLARAVGMTIPPGTAVDLFSGAGGLSCGLQLAGHEIALASDVEKAMCEAYSFNHPNVKTIQADLSVPSEYAALMSTIDETLGTERPSLLVGGPPCQGFSTAGKWSVSDNRNNLIGIMVRAIEDLSPDYFVIENVTGLSWIGKGGILRGLIERTEMLGYAVDWFILKAEQFGVPQRRRRVFIVGSTEGEPPARPISLFSAVKVGTNRSEPVYDPPGLPKPVSVKEAISDLPPLETGEVYEASGNSISDPEYEYQKAMRGITDVSDFLKRRADPQVQDPRTL